jgi:hypothetical protein
MLRDQNLFVRYDLETLEKELTVPVPEIGQIDGLIIGCASTGAGIIMTRDGPRFMDVNTLKVLDAVQTAQRWRPHPQYPLSVRASADGTTYAAWEPGLSPSGLRLLQIQGNQLVAKDEHDSAGILIPSYDGSLLFTSTGLYSPDLKPIAREEFRGSSCFPAYHPNYFLQYKSGSDIYSPSRDRNTKPKLSFYATGDRKLLFSTTDYEELIPADQERGPFGGRNALPIDKRIHFFPAANLLLTISDNREEIVLRRLNIIEQMEKSGIDYLFVSSLPATVARAGQRYEYPVTVSSRKGGVTYKLDSGPEGMAIAADGKITWSVPGNPPDGPVGVIVSIKDESGQEIYHTFNIRVGS